MLIVAVNWNDSPLFVRPDWQSFSIERPGFSRPYDEGIFRATSDTAPDFAENCASQHELRRLLWGAIVILLSAAFGLVDLWVKKWSEADQKPLGGKSGKPNKNGCLIAYGLPQEPYVTKQPSYLFDVWCPPTSPVYELSKLLKHCLSPYNLATAIPITETDQKSFKCCC